MVATSVSVVMVAWNEEQNLRTVLTALLEQTMPLKQVVLVNDGSTDHTKQIASDMGVQVIDLPFHEGSHAGTWLMAEKFNHGFRALNVKDNEFLMILGANDVLASPDYLERIVERMEANPQIVVASGMAQGFRSHPEAPRGSGRVIRGWFWRNHMKAQYPVSWGWEDYIARKATSEGYKTCAYSDLTFKSLKGHSRSRTKSYGDGASLYALGYDWFYALGRSLITRRMSTMAGWLAVRLAHIPRLDTVEYLKHKAWRLRIKRFLVRR